MFALVLKYHQFMGKMWCFLAENTLHVNRRDRYIRNAKKHLDFLMGMAKGLKDKMNSAK